MNEEKLEDTNSNKKINWILGVNSCGPEVLATPAPHVQLVLFTLQQTANHYQFVFSTLQQTANYYQLVLSTLQQTANHYQLLLTHVTSAVLLLSDMHIIS
jgi:hypothetical protein